MKRLFVAIKISPDELFKNIVYDLKKNLNYEKIKWVETENIHLTLKFFGETPENLIDDICDAIQKSSADFKKFSFNIKNAGIFGSSYKPRIIWFGIDNKKPIIDLTDSINENLKIIPEFSLDETRQNFVPHLTIGRIKMLKDKKNLKNIVNKYSEDLIQNISVEKFYLFESILKRQGPIYNVVKEFELEK